MTRSTPVSLSEIHVVRLQIITGAVFDQVFAGKSESPVLAEILRIKCFPIIVAAIVAGKYIIHAAAANNQNRGRPVGHVDS